MWFSEHRHPRPHSWMSSPRTTAWKRRRRRSKLQVCVRASRRTGCFAASPSQSNSFFHHHHHNPVGRHSSCPTTSLCSTRRHIDSSTSLLTMHHISPPHTQYSSACCAHIAPPPSHHLPAVPGPAIDNSTNLLADLDDGPTPSATQSPSHAAAPRGTPVPPSNGGALDLDSLLMGDGGASPPPTQPTPAQSAAAGAAAAGLGSLGLGGGGPPPSAGGGDGDLDDLLGFGSAPAPAHAAAPAAAQQGGSMSGGGDLVLRPQGELPPTEFMTLWTSLPVAHSMASMLSAGERRHALVFGRCCWSPTALRAR